MLPTLDRAGLDRVVERLGRAGLVWRQRDAHAWFADHRTLREVGRRMTAFEACPSWAKLPGVFAAALRG